MFTGIVEELGQVRRMPAPSRAGRMVIGARGVLADMHIGDSIAVNGVCLTVVAQGSDEFAVDVMPETLRRTNLAQLKAGDAVDLERAMAADGRFGGHIVSGHIDGTGRVRRVRREQNALIITIEAPREVLGLIVEKGSIAVDGISLTVAAVDDASFTVSLIPHTAAHTVLARRRTGDLVNLENDIIGKYVQRLLSPATPTTAQATGALTQAYLEEMGF